jgi:hypothetical protein
MKLEFASQTTDFAKILNDISKRHRAFAKAATKAAAPCQHLAFTIETKLDGERDAHAL